MSTRTNIPDLLFLSGGEGRYGQNDFGDAVFFHGRCDHLPSADDADAHQLATLFTGVVINDADHMVEGKTTVFEGFTRTDLRPTQQKTLKEIEEQNKGIELVNAEEFLLHLDRHIMNVLEQCEE